MSNYENITFENIKNNKTINIYIENADKILTNIGYSEHSFLHVTKVSAWTSQILKDLNYDNETQELGLIAGYMHDIGNIVNRINHAQSGAIIAFNILSDLNMNPFYISTIVSAIGHHDERTAAPISPVSAALILADKSDVRRSRVKNTERHFSQFDIHDRILYAVLDTSLKISDDKKYITLNIDLDDSFCSVMDFFEIFLSRMILCKKAARFLKLRFRLIINGLEIVK